LGNTTLLNRVLPWETLSAIVQGESVVDLSTMPIRSAQEAYRFVQGYGYDLHNPTDALDVKHLLGQVFHFMETALLRPRAEESAFASLNLVIPQGLKDRCDVIELLLLSSHPTKSTASLWACAFLKVLHTLVHIENAPKIQYAHLAQEQICKHFKAFLYVEKETGNLMLGNPQGASQKQLKLVAVDFKTMKSKESLLIKLLSKKTNMMDEVDDLIGFRLVTETPSDVLLALDILQENQQMVFTNINANRSRNSLIQLEEFKQVWEMSAHPTDIQDLLASHIQSWDELVANLQHLSHGEQSGVPSTTFQDHNPMSASDYRSLHITCRHLLRLRRAGSVRDERVFFPFELQFLDKETYLKNQEGETAHTQYKFRQLLRSRRRVLGALLPQHFHH
jgi:uncharacterized protein (TIGR04562 family)